jgi:hypothetical protein
MRRTLTATALLIAAMVSGDFASLRSQGSTEPPPRNLDEFDRMFNELSNWGRWGRDDQLGTINLVTPAKVRQAASLVKSGLSVSLAHNPIAESGLPDNPAQTFALQMGPDLMSDTIHFAIVGSDAATDVTPARFDGLFEPLHHFIIAGLGAPILDALDLEAVAPAPRKAAPYVKRF